MNERIFKLALKAMDFQGAVDIDTELKLTNSELAKFAELLVKECMEQVWYSREDGSNGNISQVIKDRSKEHFGVKEGLIC